MENSYKTITERAEGQYKEKGSRFLAFGFPVTDETAVKSIITSLRKEYHDARHHCYAYRIGTEAPYRYRANDDGEPSGTAGKPIYGQIISHELTNILIAVVRYFGGTLLGTSGLIHAYRSAAASMLDEAVIIERMIGVSCMLTFPYALLNRVMKIIKEDAIVHSSPVCDSNCTLSVRVPKGMLERFRGKMDGMNGMLCIETDEDPAPPELFKPISKRNISGLKESAKP